MLRLKITNEQRQRLAKKYTDSPEAYQLYLKGRHYQLKDTPEDLRKSRQYYEQAIDEDPTYALAYAGLAQYYSFMAYSGELSPKEAWPKLEAAANRAVQLAPNLGQAHSVLASTSFLYRWDWATTEREIKRALELEPNEARTHFQHSMYLRSMHRFQEAMTAVRRSEELDPLSAESKSGVALLEYYTRHYDAAAEQYRQLVRDHPELSSPHLGLYNVDWRMGNESEAVSELQKGLDLQGAADLASALPRMYMLSGFKAAKDFAIREQIRILEDASKRDYISPVAIAANYAVLGNKEKAFEWLERAYEERAPGILDLDLDPDYENLRSDARFHDLLRRIGLPE
jgi:tetratricopeptide (TPR) repeat protein